MAGIPQRLTQADIDHRNWVFSRLGVNRPVALSEILNDPPIQETIEPLQEETKEGESGVPIRSRTRRKRKGSDRETSKHKRKKG